MDHSSDDIKLLVDIAHMYYDEGAKQLDIGKKFNISRSLVSRYLKKARDLKIVEVIIHDELLNTHYNLEKNLKDKFSLRDIICVDSSHDQAVQKRRVANATSNYFLRHIKNKDIVAITGGTTVDYISNLVTSNKDHSKVVFISITGGLGGSFPNIQANLICERFARKLQAKAEYLYAPVLVDSIEARNTFLSQTFIKDVLDVGKNADILLAGIGGRPSVSTLATTHFNQIASNSDKDYSDVVGDFCYNFIDKDGHIVNCDWNDRVITLGIKQIKNIPLVIVAAEGEEKVKSIYAALKAKLIDVLVTDEKTANKLLAD